MIKIIKSGYDKVYVQLCGNCDSTFTYQRADTYMYENRRYVKCPVCNASNCVHFTEYDPKEDSDGNMDV